MDVLIDRMYWIIFFKMIAPIFLGFLLGFLLIKTRKKMIKYFTPIKTRFIGEIVELKNLEIPVTSQPVWGFDGIDPSILILHMNESYVKLKTKKKGIIFIRIPYFLYLKLKRKGKKRFSFYCHKLKYQNIWKEKHLSLI